MELTVLTTHRTRREVKPPSGNTFNFDLLCLFVSRPLALNICAHVHVCYSFAAGSEHLSHRFKIFLTFPPRHYSRWVVDHGSPTRGLRATYGLPGYIMRSAGTF
jgi:hypothetical protein